MLVKASNFSHLFMKKMKKSKNNKLPFFLLLRLIVNSKELAKYSTFDILLYISTLDFHDVVFRYFAQRTHRPSSFFRHPDIRAYTNFRVMILISF